MGALGMQRRGVDQQYPGVIRPPYVWKTCVAILTMDHVTHVQGVDSQPFDFPDNFSEIFALTLKFSLKYQYVAGSP
jgi:hypothetical protein